MQNRATTYWIYIQGVNHNICKDMWKKLFGYLLLNTYAVTNRYVSVGTKGLIEQTLINDCTQYKNHDTLDELNFDKMCKQNS